MTRIKWDEAAHVYEDMVSVLLSTLHPLVERIDGSGGDGGRDVQIRQDGRLDVFELKSLTGRLGTAKGRRPQVERSLAKAAKLEPDSWSLVVPIDHTEGELEWFDRLRAKYDFPLEWKGRTWLDKKMGEHPSVRRYYLEGSHEEVVRLLTELNAEQAALNAGAPDVLSRLLNLSAQINELDPHYRLAISLDGTTTTMTLQPRYLRAERDRPVTVRLLLHFPDTEEGQRAADKFRAHRDSGDAVVVEGEYIDSLTVDAPLGLGGEFTGGTLVLGPTEDSDNFSLAARVKAITPDGKTLASLPVLFTKRNIGRIGGTFTGQDLTGLLSVVMQHDRDKGTGEVTLQLIERDPLPLPGPMLVALRFTQALQAPNKLALETDGELVGISDIDDDEPMVHPGIVELVAALERLQSLTGTPFAVPTEFTARDRFAISHALPLLAGETVELRRDLDLTLVIQDPAAVTKSLTEGTSEAIYLPQPEMSITVAGVRVPLGSGYHYSPAAQLLNRDELIDNLPFSSGQKVRLRLRPDEFFQVQLRSEHELPGIDLTT